jgi:uncharacterized protein with NRDE domain
VGYNAAVRDDALSRNGSHYVVVGDSHQWTGHSGILVGYDHASTAYYASVVGGTWEGWRARAVQVVTEPPGSDLLTGRVHHVDLLLTFPFASLFRFLGRRRHLAGTPSSATKKAAAVIGGRDLNRNDCEFGVIAGGYDNALTSDGDGGVVVGGVSNVVDQDSAVQVGGRSNAHVVVDRHEIGIANTLFADD